MFYSAPFYLSLNRIFSQRFETAAAATVLRTRGEVLFVEL